MFNKKYLNSLFDEVINFFFPPLCVNCKKEGFFLCPECKEKIKIYSTKVQNLKINNIQSIYCATPYKDEVVKKIIHAFKFDGIHRLSTIIFQILNMHLKKCEFTKTKNQIIVPVPIHKKRLKERGFNQAELISKELTKYYNIPTYNALKRIKNTDFQSNQNNKIERFKNVKNAFLINQKLIPLIKNKDVILVDDILTTGATIKECAKELKKAKPNSIIALVIAK